MVKNYRGATGAIPGGAGGIPALAGIVPALIRTDGTNVQTIRTNVQSIWTKAKADQWGMASYIPRPDGEFGGWQQNFVEYASAHYVELGLESNTVTLLLVSFDGAQPPSAVFVGQT